MLYDSADVTWEYDWGIDGRSLAGPVLNAAMLPHRSKDPRQLAGTVHDLKIINQ